MPNKAKIVDRIESNFRKKAAGDKRLHNAYLLVYSEKLGVNLNVAEGSTGSEPAHPLQPNYMASVGKLFTATLISILQERGKLSFDDPIARYLDAELLQGLHVYKGKDYTRSIHIRHLLTQSSGLYDPFWDLLDKLLNDPDFSMTPREAIEWGKQNMKPRFEPGRKHFYTDTNYYLLGLIIEQVTGKPFHEALHAYIFDPLNMQHAYMLGCSEPAVTQDYPLAGFYIKGTDVSTMSAYPGIDYAGGGVVAPLSDLLVFMQALVNHKLVSEATLNRMLTDDFRKGTGIRYGYGIWKFVTVPVIMPAKFNCWGCVGATGAFMFYHPRTESYIIGNFNDVAYMSKALQFMILKVVKPLLKIV